MFSSISLWLVIREASRKRKNIIETMVRHLEAMVGSRKSAEETTTYEA